jgi:hypothetical protein
MEEDYIVPSKSRKKRKVNEEEEPSTPSPDANKRMGILPTTYPRNTPDIPPSPMLSPEFIGKRKPLRLDISADSPALQTIAVPLTLRYDSEDDFNLPSESSSKAKVEAPCEVE